jgi:diadenosine tetraphosphate (Ap4A) HIT family hydrolase
MITDNNISCPFCILESNRDVVIENENAFAIFDKFPVSNGHLLIIPKLHCNSYFDLDIEIQNACWDIVNQGKKLIEKMYAPSGYNIGINIDEAAGQTIPHAHIHLIPRYTGDVSNPRGGVRGVIPFKQDYKAV